MVKGQTGLIHGFNSARYSPTPSRLPYITMGRGRPKIYLTAEEKLLANRAKSKRSYYK